jgi:hypothetical protein
MQRSGQCKCGAILTFNEGLDGFKGRCPKCGAVVRLRVPKEPAPAPAPPPPPPPAHKKGRPPRPSDPRLSVVALREPGPAVPGGPDPDATTPFEPVQEVVLEPWTEPSAPPPPSFMRQFGLALVLGAITLMAVGAGGVAFFWWWSGR